MKILLFRPDHIGDMLLTTPLIRALRESFPEWEIAVLCGSWSRSILANNPHVDTVFECDFPWLARGGGGSWLRLAKTLRLLREKKFDIVLNLRKAAKESFAGRLAGGREVWGFDAGKSAWANTRRIRYWTDIHIADLYLEFAERLGGTSDRIGLELFFTDEERRMFADTVPLPDTYAVLSPGAGYPEKLWIPERWIRLADSMTEKWHIPLILTGSRDEQTMAGEIINGMTGGTAVNMAGRLSIRETALLIEKSLFAVTLDSAAMHIASAVGTPVVALFGPTNPVHWGPYPNGRTNRAVSKVSVFRKGRGSTNASGGMEKIEARDVLNAVEAVVREENIDPGASG